MEKVQIVGVEKCDGEGTVLRLSIRGHSVEAVFTAEENTEVFPKLKNMLLQTCASGLLKQEGESIPAQ